MDIIDPEMEDTIRLRVEWNGASVRGTMDVWTRNGWEPVGHLDPGTPGRDVILARFSSASESIRLTFERSEAHRDVPFRAGARSITWMPGQPRLKDRPEDFTPALGIHYIYAGTDVPSHPSVRQDNVHVLALPLDLDHYDYELWVELRHPTEENRWSKIDPIIGHANRGPTPGKQPGSTPVGPHSDAPALGLDGADRRA